MGVGNANDGSWGRDMEFLDGRREAGGVGAGLIGEADGDWRGGSGGEFHDEGEGACVGSGGVGVVDGGDGD